MFVKNSKHLEASCSFKGGEVPVVVTRHISEQVNFLVQILFSFLVNCLIFENLKVISLHPCSTCVIKKF